MPVSISTQVIHASYAAIISEIDKDANIYDNPNQQGTAYPAWFIVHRSPVEIQRELGKRLNGNRYILTYQIDIWYMVQQNITRLYDIYTQIAEQLDEKIEYLPIFGSDAIVHVYDRSWSLELNALKYSTTLRLRVFVDKDFKLEPMAVIEDIRAFIKNQHPEFYTLSFTNTDHPDFTVELPDDIIASVNSFVKLPSVSGEHEEGGELWVPDAWDIGAFGQPVKMANDITANLLWRIRPKYTLSFENTDHPQFDVDLPEPITDYQGEEIVLPAVSGEWFDKGEKFTPIKWDIGEFGDKYVLDADAAANLIFKATQYIPLFGVMGETDDSVATFDEDDQPFGTMTLD